MAQRGKFTSKGQLVIPAALRRKHGIKVGTEVVFLEDELGRIVIQPMEQFIDQTMGCLAGGPDSLANWMTEHREEGERDK